MSRKRKPNADEATMLRAIRAWRDRGDRSVNEIRAQFGITSSQLHRWIAKYPDEAKLPTRGSKLKAPPVNEAPSPRGTSELARLRREVVQLKEEITVLTKTIKIFARSR